MFRVGSWNYDIENRIQNLEAINHNALYERMGEAEDDILSLKSRCGAVETTLGLHGGRLTTLENTAANHSTRITALETWKSSMAKRQDRYTGTTDANGDVTITFPSGRYAAAPSIEVTYIFNNDNYGAFYNIKAVSKDSVTLRLMRNKNSAVLLGGNIDPDESLPSTAIVLVATEF